MKSFKRTILTASIICTGFITVCFAEQKESKASIPNVDELLAKCTQTLDKTHTSFITKSKIQIQDDIKHADPKLASENLKRKKFLLKEFRTDGKRLKIITEMWYNKNYSIANSKAKRQYSSITYNGQNRYDHTRPYNGPGKVTVFNNFAKSASYNNFLETQLAYSDPTSKCFGYLTGDIERFDRILKRTDPKQITVRKSVLNRMKHYLIDAKTKNGRYKIWLNPEKGFNYSKAIVQRNQGDTFFGRYTVEPGTTKKSIMENLEFRKVNNLWVPVKARSKMSDTLPGGGHMKAAYEIKLTSIVLNPDHDKLGSFLVNDIKNGSKVHIEGGSFNKYTWAELKASGKLGGK